MHILLNLGRLAGIAGALLCIVGAAARFNGSYWIAGFQVSTLLQAGTAAMVFGCLCLLAVLTQRS